MQKEKTILGPMEMKLLAFVQLKRLDTIRKGEISPFLGISSTQERKLLSRMSNSGLIIRLKRGVYLVPPRIPPSGRWTPSEYLVLSKLMKVYDGKYQISGPNAFNYYGYEDQIPNRIYVYNNKIYGEKNIGGAEFVFIKTSKNRLGANKTYKTTENIEITIVSRARALMDAVYDWSRYNTIPRAYKWIIKSFKEEPGIIQELLNVTLKYGNKATIRRIGYLIEEQGFALNSLEKLKKKMGSSKSLIPWVPNRGRKGTINRDWALIINDTIPG
ncbi:MAG: hypothetical protein JXC33_07585 [Deltaproteobacteria bacterium]|nr:hypothetical protein [Deltaproteobacteria bacterium]